MVYHSVTHTQQSRAGCISRWLYCIDLFSCVAASLFNKLTYLLTIASTCVCVLLRTADDVQICWQDVSVVFLCVNLLSSSNSTWVFCWATCDSVQFSFTMTRGSHAMCCVDISMMIACWLPVTGLYRKGLVYLDVPIADTDYIVGKLMLRILSHDSSVTVCWLSHAATSIGSMSSNLYCLSVYCKWYRDSVHDTVEENSSGPALFSLHSLYRQFLKTRQKRYRDSKLRRQSR